VAEKQRSGTAKAPSKATSASAKASPATKATATSGAKAKPTPSKAKTTPAMATKAETTERATKKAPTKSGESAAKPAAKKTPVKSGEPAAKPAGAKADPAKPAAKKPAAAKPAAAKPAAKPAAVPSAADTQGAAEGPVAAAKPSARKPPPFGVGDKVVYPHHGAATITAIRQMEFQGEKRQYYVLEVATDQLIVSVPVDGALELGVRPVISTNVARKVFATFREEPQEAGANWSRWYKLLTEKINSGDIFQVAEVVRDLTYAQQVKGISPALKRMLAKARLIIVSELRFALKLDEEDAIRRLDRALPRVDEPVEL
jgi:CarD family transcriptional regulator